VKFVLFTTQTLAFRLTYALVPLTYYAHQDVASNYQIPLDLKGLK